MSQAVVYSETIRRQHNAEREVEQAERRAEQEQASRERAEREVQQTTFDEFLTSVHEISGCIPVQHD